MATPVKRPGGARPNPTRIAPPPKLSIPEGNVPGINVDSADQGGWQYPQSLPSLALNPVKSATSSSRPKLSLSAISSPAASPAPLPPTVPSSCTPWPPLLNAPSADAGSSRAATPALKLAVPGVSGASSGFNSAYEYPNTDDDNDFGSDLKTPLAIGGDRNPTLQARGRDYDGESESSYGYGRMGNGLEQGQNGSQMSMMTQDIRQALSRSRYDSSPRPSLRSRANSAAGSAPNSSRRSSFTSSEDVLALTALTITESPNEYDQSSGSERRESLENCEENEPTSPVFEPAELEHVRRLGEGTGGAVELVKDPRSGRIMAKKVIARTTNPDMHKQLLRELKILDQCSSPYIVDHYGSFLAERDSQVGILMEYCEGGSLDSLMDSMKTTGMRCSEHVLGRIASSVLRGLDYLHKRRIVHRDIKPSNILLTRNGMVKLCDFGVSGETVNSIAGTFTGTSYYMAPERIQGRPYTIKADVWSLGLTLHEVAHLRFPFPPEGECQSVAPIELLSYIVTAPVPVMVNDPALGRTWSPPIQDFMSQCLVRSGTDRPYPRQLLSHPYIVTSESKKVNMAKWVTTLCGMPPG